MTEKYCFEHLPDAESILKGTGRTGVEAHVAAKNYENRFMYYRERNQSPIN